MKTLEGIEKAVAELDLAIRARFPLLAVETTEESRALATIIGMAGQPVINMAGNTEIESRLVFRWTHTDGTRRVGKMPVCKCGATVALVRDEDNPVYFYHCPACGQNTDVEFQPDKTTDPSWAIQDFITWANGDGTSDSHKERASILVLCDIHRWLDTSSGKDPVRTMRALRDLAMALPPTQSVAVMLAPFLGKEALGDAESHTHRIKWPLPTVKELAQMIREVGAKLEGRIEVDLNGGTEDLAAACAALTYEQATRVMKLTVVEHRRLTSDLAPVVMAKKAEILQNVAGIKIRTPRFGLADVGGLDVLKGDVANLPRMLSQAAKEAMVRAPKGFLLAGPPGTGKSLLAEAMAAAANVPLMEWSMGQSKSQWYGQTERQVFDVLRAADAVNKCVLLIDEGEKQTSSGQTGEGHEVTEAVMGALLSWMQNRESDVIVVMAVNHPEKLRDELVSRFDSRWFVDYPDADAAAQIIRIHTSRRGIAADDLQIKLLAGIAVGAELSPREIEYVVEDVKRQAFIRDIEITDSVLSDAFSQARGLASQPKRKTSLESMRAECKGQFRDASSSARGTTGQQVAYSAAPYLDVNI